MSRVSTQVVVMMKTAELFRLKQSRWRKGLVLQGNPMLARTPQSGTNGGSVIVFRCVSRAASPIAASMEVSYATTRRKPTDGHELR